MWLTCSTKVALLVALAVHQSVSRADRRTDKGEDTRLMRMWSAVVRSSGCSRMVTSVPTSASPQCTNDLSQARSADNRSNALQHLLHMWRKWPHLGPGWRWPGDSMDWRSGGPDDDEYESPSETKRVRRAIKRLNFHFSSSSREPEAKSLVASVGPVWRGCTLPCHTLPPLLPGENYFFRERMLSFPQTGASIWAAKY